MKEDRIVILGVGNVLLRDEGVGVHVVEELRKRYSFPKGVNLVDGGTQGLWLIPTLQQADHLIVLDAVLGNGLPGTIYRLEKDDLPKGLRTKTSAHDADLVEALNLCSLIGEEPQSVVVIGVEPEDITQPDLNMSNTVAAKVDELIDRVLEELQGLGVEPRRRV